VAHLERQFLEQPIHQGRSVAVEEPHETDFAFLRVALGEGEGLRALELAPESTIIRLEVALGGALIP